MNVGTLFSMPAVSPDEELANLSRHGSLNLRGNELSVDTEFDNVRDGCIYM